MINLGIVIPSCKDGDYIDLTLEALEDQDYKNFRVVIVNDGKDLELEKRILNHTTNNTFSYQIDYKTIDKSGASKARNVGFDVLKDSKLKYLLFLDDDCQILPGILTNMTDILKKNKDVSFVYGDYEFENGQRYISRPFNPYTLRTFNYISTMSMLRKKDFKSFNESLPYFQDWDMFYNLVKRGKIGYYLKEVIFKTRVSDSSNISGIKLSLNEKCKVFRKANNIKDSKLVVTTLGCSLQGEQRAEILDADFAGTNVGGRSGVYPNYLKFEDWTHTYVVGVFNYPVSALEAHLKACVGRPILHFVGTDVFQLWEKQSPAIIERIRNTFIKHNAILLVNSNFLKAEMDKVGINTHVLYTPVYQPDRFKISEAPKEFIVGVYYSDSQNMNYFNTSNPMDNSGGESNLYMIWEVAKALPNIKFKFFGGKAKFTTENVEFCGKIPFNKMPEFIESCSTIVRSTIHDSLPQLPLQFLLSGRRIITSSNLINDNGLSFTDIIDYDKSKSEVIEKIMDVKRLGNLSPYEYDEAVTFIYDTMSKDYFKKTIYDIMKLGVK